MNIPLFEKCNVLLSLVINNSPVNRFPISNSTYVQIFCDKYIPLLCRIWPGFIQKSSLFYQQSVGMIQACVPNSQFSPFVDKAVLTVQLITYTVLQNCLSLFHYSQFTVIHFLGGLSLHLNHLIASRAANYDWPFGTLPFGLFG